MRLNVLSGSRAWQAGALVYLVMVLTSGLLAAPWVAAGLEFGHWHPDDQPAHVHQLTGVMAGAITAALVAVEATFTAPTKSIARPLAAHDESVLHAARGIRAPPSPS
ncbi:MAG TPA: hypothetical protein VF168_04935 [Trueperaceae bacterium]